MPPKKNLKRKLQQELGRKQSAPAGKDDIPKSVLLPLVKAAQKHKLGDWQAFIKVAAPKQKKSDPAAHTEEVLRAYVKHLLSGEEAAAAGDTADGKKTKSVIFVERYIKCSQQLQKEQARKATSIPPPSTIKALNTPSAPVTAPSVSSASSEPMDTSTAQGTGTAAAPCSNDNRDALLSPWGLVQASRNHPKFRTLYNLPSYMSGWARTKRRAVGASQTSTATPSSSKKSSKKTEEPQCQEAQGKGLKPRLLAMDCEMCETDREQSALVGLCVSDEKGEVLYKALVRPRGTVVNLRTELTGITQEDLDTKPTVSRSEARKAVKGLLLEALRSNKQPTILVGHALHHDLIALRLDHQPIIDTSLIFTYRGLPACTPGLRDLSRAVLKQDMPARGQGRHDSIEDAAVAMLLVVHELAQKCRTPAMDPPEIKVDTEELCKLLVHSIPRQATEQEILDLFAGMTGNGATAAGGAEPSSSTPTPQVAHAAAAAGGPSSIKKSADAAEGNSGSSSSDDDDSSSSSSGSGSSSDESEADGQPHKRQKTPQGHRTPQQQKTEEGGSGSVPNSSVGKSAGKSSAAGSASSSDSSDSGSDSDSDEEGGKGVSKQGGEGKGVGAGAATTTGVGLNGNAGSGKPPQPIGFEGGGIESRRAVLVFHTPGDANAAFSSLVGTSSTDSNGRTTKEVPLPGEGPARTIKVRRMAAHNGLLFQATKAKQARPQKGTPKQGPTLGPDGQPMTRRDKFRQRELQKKGKTPQDLLAAQAKNMKKLARRAKKKERKATAKEARGEGTVVRTANGGVKLKRQRPFVKKTPAQKAAAAAAVAATVAAGGVVPKTGGKQKKVTKKDLKKAAKKADKAARKERAMAKSPKS